MTDVCVYESLSIFVQDLISEFLTVNDFILSWMLIRVSSYPITTLLAGASLGSKRSSLERTLG